MDNLQSKKYFGASNSAKGFVNYFPQIFNENTCGRIYAVKGGPGTGKSRFMRDVANEAERLGMKVTYYYCSSDADSLDGIIIEDIKVGFLDGTAPHTYELRLSGAFDQIVNLGDFWDEKRLAERRNEIAELVSKKSLAYENAYAILASYGSIVKAIDGKIAPLIDRRKLASAVKRLLHKLPENQSQTPKIGLKSSVGMSGERSFDTYERDAELLFSVTDYHGAARAAMQALYDEMLKRRMLFAVSYDPIIFSCPDSLLLGDCGVAFATGVISERIINAKRFVDTDKFKAVKDEVKNLEGLADKLRAAAILSFEDVKMHHFALEKIYSDTMDFERKEKYTEEFIKRLF